MDQDEFTAAASFMLQDLVHRNASSVIFAARQTPKVTMDVFEVKKLERDLWSVRVRLVNSGAIPSVTFQTMKNKLYPIDMLPLFRALGEGGKRRHTE
ncbi:MAG: hypothetical protein R2758_08225 [Bacteroidales bacterium]